LEPEHLTRRFPDCDLGVGTLSRSEGEELQDAQPTGRGAFLLADLAIVSVQFGCLGSGQVALLYLLMDPRLNLSTFR
jgi:hypothetical protein